MRARIRFAAFAGCLLALLLAPRAGATVSLQPVGTFDQPMFIASPPGDPRLFVVERSGFIQVLHDGTRSEFLDISSLVRNTGEQGLLSMAFDPNYASNGLFYVFFNDSGSAGATAGDIHIDEFHVGANPNSADTGSRRRVMTLVRNTGATNHNGGQLQFGPDGLLYISVGDAATSANAQALANPHGKVLRIDPHGSGQDVHGVPADNPFVGVGGATPEIWSLGLRNPFRFSFDHLTGDLVIGDVGQNEFEEIDFAPASTGLARGANFGWPNCEGFSGSCPGTTPPVFAYAHPSAPSLVGYAIIGGYVYRGNQIPELTGRYLYTDLGTGEIHSIQLGLPLAGGDRAETALHALSTPASFGQDASCNLYVTSGDAVERIVGTTPVASAPACETSPTQPVAQKKKCKKRHHKKKHRAAEAKKKKHKKKKCKKRKKKHRR
jgi:glucose/arabinose dehydrogenase